MSWFSLWQVAPVWLPVAAAAVILLLAVNKEGQERDSRWRSYYLLLVALVALASALWLLLGRSERVAAFSGAVVVDGIGVTFGAVVLLGGLLAVLLAHGYLREHGLAAGEFYALVLLASCGALTLVMAGDLMTLFIGLETMSLAVYVLSGFRRRLLRAQEAAVKYFIYGAFASAFVLFGMALIYGEVGRLAGEPAVSLAALSRSFGSGKPIALLGWCGVALVVAGFGFKLAWVPFHMWAPDVYEGAPTPVAGFMAVLVKAAAFAGLVRFVLATLVASGKAPSTLVQVFEVLAILTMLTGNFLAVRQTAIKRMLAYSSIAHAGYALVGVVALLTNSASAALAALTYYLLAYTLMTLGAFGVLCALERRNDGRAEFSLERLAGMGRRYPGLALAMALFMLGLAGIPPLAGFFGKLALFAAAIAEGRIALVVVAVIASMVGAYYYLRVLVLMYMRAASSTETQIRSVGLRVGLAVCASATVLVGLWPQDCFTFLQRALLQL